MSVDFMAWLKALLAGQFDQDQPTPDDKPRLNWYAEARQEAVRLISLDPDSALTVAYTRSGNGFLREMAVLALDAHPGTEALEAIIERLNDWVPAVRRAAKAQFATYLTGERVTYVISSLHLLIQLTVRGRDDHKVLLKQVSEVLALPDMRERVRRWFPMLRLSAARQVMEWMMAWPDFDLSDTLALATRSTDPAVRAMAYRKAREEASAETFQLLANGLNETMPALRNLALSAWLERAADQRVVEEQLLHFVLSPAVSTRELAAWHAKKRGMDLSALVTAQLQTPPADAHALVGLLGLSSLVKVSAALPLVEHSLTSSSAAVRKAAWQALVQLDVQVARQHVERLLLDPSRKVFAAVLVSVRSNTALELEAGELRAVINAAVAKGALQQAALLASLQSVWGQVATLLLCFGMVNVVDQVFLQDQLRRWSIRQQRSYTITPSESDLAGIRALMAQLSADASAAVKKQWVPAFQQYLPKLSAF